MRMPCLSFFFFLNFGTRNYSNPQTSPTSIRVLPIASFFCAFSVFPLHRGVFLPTPHEKVLKFPLSPRRFVLCPKAHVFCFPEATLSPLQRAGDSPMFGLEDFFTPPPPPLLSCRYLPRLPQETLPSRRGACALSAFYLSLPSAYHVPPSHARFTRLNPGF